MISLVNGDAVSMPLADGSVNLIVTSPPYFGLRRYDAGPGEIGSEPTPAEFVEALRTVARECWRVLRDDGVMVINLGDTYAADRGYQVAQTKDAGSKRGDAGQFNDMAMKVPPGLNPGSRIGIPWRVALALMDDGWTLRQEVIWQKKSAMPESVGSWTWRRCRVKVGGARTVQGGVEMSVAEEHRLRPSDGKTLQFNDQYTPAEWSDCPGCPTCAPNDGLVLKRGSWRPTTAHEQIFVFVKGMGYFGDGEAVKTESKSSLHQLKSYHSADNPKYNSAPDERWLDQTDGRVWGNLSGANPRSVMTFKATNYGGAHYATFPTTLPEFFIRAYTPEAGVCSECGEPWARVVESHTEYRSNAGIAATKSGIWNLSQNDHDRSDVSRPEHDVRFGPTAVTQSLGFRRTCSHDAPAKPAVVLDPFVGSGSTLIAARALNRSGIGIDLSFDYLVNQARERLGLNAVAAWANGVPRAELENHADLPMFAANGAK